MLIFESCLLVGYYSFDSPVLKKTKDITFSQKKSGLWSSLTDPNLNVEIIGVFVEGNIILIFVSSMKLESNIFIEKLESI